MFLNVLGRELEVDAQHDIKKTEIVRVNGKKKIVNGSTTVIIRSSKSADSKTFKGVSYCSSVDQFTKKEGFKRALKRAMEKASLNRQERTVMWKHFRGEK